MMENFTYTWDLMQALESASPARHQLRPLIPSIQIINKEEAQNQKMINSKEIVSYCLGLNTQNPGLTKVDFEPNPKRGSDKINMLRQGKQATTENKSYCTAWNSIR